MSVVEQEQDMALSKFAVLQLHAMKFYNVLKEIDIHYLRTSDLMTG